MASSDPGRAYFMPVRPKQKKRGGRINAKKGCYTWPMCPLSPSFALKHLTDIAPVSKFAIVYTPEPWVGIGEVPKGELRAFVRYRDKQMIPFKRLNLVAPDGTVYGGIYVAAKDASCVAHLCSGEGTTYLTNMSCSELQSLKDKAE